MTSAPGQSSSQQEPVCYNCGLKGHWVVACPEPTREVPAGLQRWQSQQHDHAQRPERNNGGLDKKPPVVTRYGPPPVYASPAAQYGALPPPPPYPPAGSPSGQAPYPPSQYPPPPQQPFFGPGYPPPLPPGQPQYGAYPPPPPPPPFNQQQSPPPHSLYGPPPPGTHYPPPQPPHPSPPPPPAGYYNGPQPPYPPAPYQTPPYPPQPNYQVPPYPPSGPPPPPAYHQLPYPPPQYPPNPTHGYPPTPLPPPPIPPPPPVSFQPDSAWSQPPPPHTSQQPRPRHQRGKKKARDRRLSWKGKGHKGHDRDRSSPVLKSVLPDREGASPIEPHHAAETQEEPEPGEVAEDGEEVDTFDDWRVDVEPHFEVVFAESSGKPADPVGIPLPYTYTDEPTIPPAYNATCIKSEFFKEGRVDEFIVPVQKSREWPLLLSDPAFKRYAGMMDKTFHGFDGLVYATYGSPSRHPKGAPVKLPPKFRIDRRALEQAYQRQRSLAGDTSPQQTRDNDRDRRHFLGGNTNRDFNDHQPEPDNDNRGSDRTPQNRPVKRGIDDSRHSESRDFKRHRRSPSHQDTPTSSGRGPGPNVHHSPPARPEYERSAWSPHVDDRYDRVEKRHRSIERGDRMARSPSRRRDGSSERRQREKSVNARHDSGYHSGQSPGKSRRHADQDEDRSRARKRSLSRDNPYSRDRQPRSRSPEGRASRASSATASNDRSRSSSPLTAMDYELLGLSRPKQKASAVVRKRLVKRQVKVSSAYGRRW